jgi:hypothetical protein
MRAFADAQSSLRGLNVLQAAGSKGRSKERNRLIFSEREQRRDAARALL